MSTPMSTIRICSGVRLNNSYNHTIWFPDSGSQLDWFLSKTVKTFSAYSYLRKSWSIKVDATMNDALKWSYLYFSNGGKNFFYFINNIEYINDSTVELFLEMDVMQTYMFDYDLLDCFVEREHSALDVIGDNLIDEGLEVGEYVSIADTDVDLNDYLVMIMSTANPEKAGDSSLELDISLGNKYDNVFSGVRVFAVPLGKYSALQAILENMDGAGNSECIIAMWMYPGELVSKSSAGDTVYAVSGSNSFTKDVTRNTVLADSYKPRNNKLFTYPYNFLYVTNNTGDGAAYPYEYFGDPANPYFKLVGSVSPDGCVRMYPLNYKGTQHNFESGLTLGSFPTCSWDSDVYKLWLAQNQNSQNFTTTAAIIKAAAGVGSAAFGAATANIPAMIGGASMAYSGMMDIQGLMAQRADKSIQPDEAKGRYSSTVNMSAGFQTFTIRKKCITKQQAARLDGFFDMYGYKTLQVKKPNRHCRKNWTYTKTVGCKIKNGTKRDICTADQLKIESIYNNGVTFWVNGDSIGDYSLNNACTGEV